MRDATPLADSLPAPSDYDRLGKEPLPHSVMRADENHYVAELQRKGVATPIDYSPAAASDYTCVNNRMTLRPKPRLSDNDPDIITMADYATFGDTPPSEHVAILSSIDPAKPHGISDNLFKNFK